MRLIKARTVVAAVAMAGGALIGGFAVADTASAATPSCTGCEGAQFTANGVNIRSCASTSCTSLGLGYESHTVRVYCTGTVQQNGFVHIDDLTTGVSGWSSEKYVLWGCD
jgi:hypothetical protein